MSQEELSKFTVIQLKEKLREQGLPVSGTKSVLIDSCTGSTKNMKAVCIFAQNFFWKISITPKLWSQWGGCEGNQKH
jgi:hypothetical protein